VLLLHPSKSSGKSNHGEKAKMPSSNPGKGLKKKYSFISTFFWKKLIRRGKRENKYFFTDLKCLLLLVSYKSPFYNLMATLK